jgi:transposase InsO family protein
MVADSRLLQLEQSVCARTSPALASQSSARKTARHRAGNSCRKSERYSWPIRESSDVFELQVILHLRTAFHHPESNSYIERFHRSLKEEEVWTVEYRSLEEARASIARWIEEYNHDRPHRGVGNRTPREAFLSFAALTKSETLNV